MAKKVTIRDIAQKAQVSPASVSMILNRKSISRFSEETVDLVCHIAYDLGYESKHFRQSRSPVYIICPSIMNPYYATLIQSMEQEARSQNYRTVIVTTYWDIQTEQEALELAKNNHAAGVIFSMIPQQPSLAVELNKTIPVVAVGDKKNDLALDTVDVNNYNAGRMVAQHLIELGHKHVAYVSTTLNSEHSARVRRCLGLQDEYLHSCPEGDVKVFSTEVSSSTELHVTDIEHAIGYQLTRQCLKEAPEVTAIVAINDMVAYGVVDAIKDAGLRIPEDYSVCGFDNIYPSSFSGVQLTTIEHAIEERGQSAFRLLAEKLSAQKNPANAGAITRLEYQSRLAKRETTAPPSR